MLEENIEVENIEKESNIETNQRKWYRVHSENPWNENNEYKLRMNNQNIMV